MMHLSEKKRNNVFDSISTQLLCFDEKVYDLYLSKSYVVQDKKKLYPYKRNCAGKLTQRIKKAEEHITRHPKDLVAIGVLRGLVKIQRKYKL